MIRTAAALSHSGCSADARRRRSKWCYNSVGFFTKCAPAGAAAAAGPRCHRDGNANTHERDDVPLLPVDSER